MAGMFCVIFSVKIENILIKIVKQGGFTYRYSEKMINFAAY